MNPLRCLPTGLLLAATVAGILATGTAGAQTSTPTPEQRRQAGAAYDQALAARAAGNHAEAASLFETAYRLAPSPQALGNAIREHREVRTPAHDARAATLSLRLLAQYGNDSRIANYAQQVIQELSRRLERVTVHCSNCDLEVDQQLTSDREFFVEPGRHTLVAHFSGQQQRTYEFIAEPGGTEEVTLTPPADTSSVQTTTPAQGPTPRPSTTAEGRDTVSTVPAEPTHASTQHGATSEPARTPSTRGGLPPWVFITGTVITVGLGGALIWSGLDTLSGAESYRMNPTPAGLEDGQARELRTNILAGATALAGAATITTLFFTRWGEGRTETAPVVTSATGIAPGLTFRGRF